MNSKAEIFLHLEKLSFNHFMQIYDIMGTITGRI